MSYILVQHSVEDYEKWKPVFDENGPIRQAAGSRGARVLRNADDPNHVTVLLEWDTMANARAFAGSDDLREAMERAGVAGPPNVSFLEEVDRLSV
jgi:heme-degrading monooxygenase HmoA